MQDYIPIENLDVNDIIPPFSIKQYDNESRTLHISLVDKDNPKEKSVNLENHSVSAYYELPDGKVIRSEGSIAEPVLGRISVTIPGAATQITGDVKCEIVITGNDDSSLSLPVFYFSVIASLSHDAVSENEQGG